MPNQGSILLIEMVKSAPNLSTGVEYLSLYALNAPLLNSFNPATGPGFGE